MTHQQEPELIAKWLGIEHAGYQVCLMAAGEGKEGKE